MIETLEDLFGKELIALCRYGVSCMIKTASLWNNTQMKEGRTVIAKKRFEIIFSNQE